MNFLSKGKKNCKNWKKSFQPLRIIKVINLLFYFTFLFKTTALHRQSVVYHNIMNFPQLEPHISFLFTELQSLKQHNSSKICWQSIRVQAILVLLYILIYLNLKLRSYLASPSNSSCSSFPFPAISTSFSFPMFGIAMDTNNEHGRCDLST